MKIIATLLLTLVMSGCAGTGGYFGTGYPPGHVYSGVPIYGGFVWGGYGGGYPGRYAYSGWRPYNGWRPNHGYSPWCGWNRGHHWHGPAMGFRRPYPGPGFAPGWKGGGYRGGRGGFG